MNRVSISSLEGVGAITQIPPGESLIAVERPPIGNHPMNRENGFEKVTTSGVICPAYWGPHTMNFGPEWMEDRSETGVSRMKISATCVGGGEGNQELVGREEREREDCWPIGGRVDE